MLSSRAAVVNASSLHPEFSGLSRLSRLITYYYNLHDWLTVMEALALAGTRLLVASGFPKTVRRQLGKLALIHPAYNLSGLRVRLLSTPQSYTWNYAHMADPTTADHWGGQLERLKNSTEWREGHSQVALLACGAYGLPLARHAKSRNISSIYAGGILPLLFGIAGKRHRELPQFSSHINHHWVSPLPEESPHGKENVEGGAYWRRSRQR